MSKIPIVLASIAPEVVEGVTKVLEERAISAQAVTPAQLEGLLTGVLERAGVLDLVARAKAAGIPAGVPDAVAAPAVNIPRPQAYLWGGSFHRLPEDYAMPKGNLRVAFQAFMAPNADKGYPRLRDVTPHDLPRNQRKGLSNMRFAMSVVEKLIKEEAENAWIENPTFVEANTMFDRVADQLVAKKTPRQRVRRLGELEWTTAVNLMRERGLKRRRMDDNSDNSDGAEEIDTGD